MPQKAINLIRIRPGLHPTAVALLHPLRLGSLILFAIVVLLGIATALLHYFIKDQFAKLTQAEKQYTDSIISNKVREELYTAVKHRLSLVEKVQESQFSWSMVLDDIVSAIEPSMIQSLTVDDTQKISVNLKMQSVDQARKFIDTMALLTKERKITQTQLVSLSIDLNGEFLMIVSFIPVMPSIQT